MPMTLPDGEPQAEPWRALDTPELVARILRSAGEVAARPRLVAVDGRGASGKSSLAAALQAAVPRSALVHTDDIAWNEPLFAWGNVLREGVLMPLHRGEPVRFRPPAWQPHGRSGGIQVEQGLDLVLIEGVGASQAPVADVIDLAIWVQADFDEAERRGIQRDIAQGVNGDSDQTIAFWHYWMAAELAFLAKDRPWERAGLVVAGTPVIELEAGQFAVAVPHPGNRPSTDSR